MKKPLTRFAVVILLLGFTPTYAASAPKPGTKCAKAGLTQTVSGKKYTCTKSGSKLTWNKGVTVPAKVQVAPSVSASSEPLTKPAEVLPMASATSSPSAVPALVKFKNCTEAKAAGVAPLIKVKSPELYELNAGLDRDKDGIACEN